MARAKSAKSESKKSKKAERSAGEAASKKWNILADRPEKLAVEGLALAALGAPAAAWQWHYGKVTGLGSFSTAGGKEVVILWDEGGSSRMQGGIADSEWEIFKMAFAGSGRIAVMSDKSNQDWKFDYRFLEAQR